MRLWMAHEICKITQFVFVVNCISYLKSPVTGVHIQVAVVSVLKKNFDVACNFFALKNYFIFDFCEKRKLKPIKK